MSGLLLKDARAVYRVSASHNKPLSILIRGGLIDVIDTYENILSLFNHKLPKDIDVIDCTDRILMPGFVDSHTHLLFFGSRENEFYMRAAGKSYLEILKEGGGIYNTVNAVRAASEEELIQNGLKFLDKAIRFGTTTVEVKSGYGLDYQTEEKMLRIIRKLDSLHPVDVIPTFLVHTVPKEVNRQKYLQTVLNEMIPGFKSCSDWFDVFLEKDVFTLEEGETLIRKAMDTGYHVGIHTNQVHDIGGVSLAVQMGVRHVDHLEVLTRKDARLIKECQNIYPVFFPSAEAFVFSRHTGQIRQLLEIPNRIVLSTDFNPGSSPVLSPAAVMTMAVLRYRISDTGLIIDSFCSNPADMLYLKDIGRIVENAKADVIGLDLESFDQLPYFGTLDNIDLVIKTGIKIFQQ